LKKIYSPLLFGKEDSSDSVKFAQFVDTISGYPSHKKREEREGESEGRESEEI
jgi:hypothetical protein